jgi:hypothetical protein
MTPLRSVITCLSCIGLGITLYAGVSRETADWLQANAGAVDGTRVWVKVASVNAGAVVEGGQLFMVYTYDEGAGSWIEAMVAKEYAGRFLEKYRNDIRFDPQINVRTKRLGATARLHPRLGYVWLDCRDWRP